LSEMRTEMKELAKSVTMLTNATTEFITNQKHTDAEIEEIKGQINGDNGLHNRVGGLEIAQAEDKRNWAFTAAICSILFAAFVGYYITIVKPIQNSNVQSEAVRLLIQEINEKL